MRVDSVTVWQCGQCGEQTAQCGETEWAVGREVGAWELPSTTLHCHSHHTNALATPLPINHTTHYSHCTTAVNSLSPVLEKVLNADPSWLGLNRIIERGFSCTSVDLNRGDGIRTNDASSSKNTSLSRGWVDKPARLIIRLLFGFVSDSVSRKKVKVLRRQCCLRAGYPVQS